MTTAAQFLQQQAAAERDLASAADAEAAEARATCMLLLGKAEAHRARADEYDAVALELMGS